MNFTTPVLLNIEQFPKFSYDTSMMTLGSCFSSNIGDKLVSSKFNCVVNPYGVLYNPASIASVLNKLLNAELHDERDIFMHDELWNSWMHHGSFSTPSKEDLLTNINDVLQATRKQMKTLNALFLTFGTSWVYQLKEENRVVANCHKVPERNFNRYKLSVQEILLIYQELIDRLILQNKELKIIFSISPIRHIRDGLVENQLSKATLLVATHELCRLYPSNCFYFPSYEIMVDELRDYRFYTDDMVHPTTMAINYLWEQFKSVFFEKETIDLILACEKIFKDLNHRPLKPNSNQYIRFLEHLVEKMEQITKKRPTLDFRKEIELCLIKLNKSRK